MLDGLERLDNMNTQQTDYWYSDLIFFFFRVDSYWRDFENNFLRLRHYKVYDRLIILSDY